MRLFCETNFLLEVALDQNQSRACKELLNLGESKLVELVIPACSVTEAQLALETRHLRRTDAHKRLQQELGELRRSEISSPFAGQLGEGVLALLLETIEHETLRLQSAEDALLRNGRVIETAAMTLRRARSYALGFALATYDALVLASVHEDVVRDSAESCFVTRDTDFRDPDIISMLKPNNCRVLFDFEEARNYVVSLLEAS